MSLLVLLLLGLVVGAVAKLIMPGKDPGGILVTMLIGVAGSYIGAFGGAYLGIGTVSGFDLKSLALAVGGSMLLLLVFRLFKGKS